MLKIASNNKNLIVSKDNEPDKPFFWFGDTAWLLLQKLNMTEIKNYFINRSKKHFNVIQAVLVHNLNFENPDIAVTDGKDFSHLNPNHEYWDKAEAVVQMAEKYGLYMGLLPVWGSMVKKGYLTEDNVRSYGEFLAERFGKYSNIVWILGGDIRGYVGFEIWNILGSTLKELCPDKLITFHPFGRTSSAIWFNDQSWLDFNMFQSGHRRYDQASLGEWDDNKESEDFFAEDNWKYVRRDTARTPKKPILDGEPSYENIPQGLHDFTQPVWLAKDVRRYAYWSVFEGACGHSYGNNSIFQFYSKGPERGGYNAYKDWRDEMDAPGAAHLGHMYELITGFDYTNGSHNDKLTDNDGFVKHDRITAYTGKDYALIYNYTGREFKLSLSALDFAPTTYKWFDPTNGNVSEFTPEPGETIVPPKNSNGETDMVLIIC